MNTFTNWIIILTFGCLSQGCGKLELTPPTSYSDYCALLGWDEDAKSWKYLCKIPNSTQQNSMWFSWVPPVGAQNVPTNCFTDDERTCRK